jgi:hypothetical protein
MKFMTVAGGEARIYAKRKGSDRPVRFTEIVY